MTTDTAISDLELAVATLASCTFLSSEQFTEDMELECLEPVQGVRRLLANENPPLDAACSLGVPSMCFKILSNASNADLLFETAWVATNIASGQLRHTNAILEAECHVPLVTLLTNPSVRVMEQAAWAIGNIAGESVMCRDRLLQMRCTNDRTLIEQLTSMHEALSKEVPLTKALSDTKAVVVWVVSNLCRGKPQPPLGLLQPCFPFLKTVLREGQREAVIDALWCLAYISDGSNDRIQAVLEHGLLGEALERLSLRGVNCGVVKREHDYYQTEPTIPTHLIANAFEFLPTVHLKRVAFGCKDWFYDIIGVDIDLYARARAALTNDKNVESVVLRVLGNVVTGDDCQTDAALKLGFLDIVEQLAGKRKESSTRKELCWALSNVTAGSSKQVKMVLERQRIVEFLCASLHDWDLRVVREAAWTVANATQHDDIVRFVVDTGLPFHMFLAIVNRNDGKLMQVAREGLQNISSHISADLADDVIQTHIDNGVRDLPKILKDTRNARHKFPEYFASFEAFHFSLIVPLVLVLGDETLHPWANYARDQTKQLSDHVSQRLSDDVVLRNTIEDWERQRQAERARLEAERESNVQSRGRVVGRENTEEDVGDAEEGSKESEDDDADEEDESEWEDVDESD